MYLLNASGPFNITFRTGFLSIEEWATNFVFKDYANSIFTNGSRMEMGTGSRIVPDYLYISVSLRLANTCMNSNVVKSKCLKDCIKSLDLMKDQRMELL